MEKVKFKVRGKLIGDSHDCFIIAEIGANHDGDPEKARQIIDQVADAGADAVKFQTYSAQELLVDPDRKITWGKKDKLKTETIGDLFDRVALPRKDHKSLFDYASSKGLIAFSTPFSIDSANFLNDLDVPLWKVASSDVRDKFLLDNLIQTGKPIIMSTGKSFMWEISRAVELIRRNNIPFAILHCVAQYPAPFADLNLATISAFRRFFPDAVVGFSDHSQGITAALGAVSLGAKIIERHVTYDNNGDGPDHWFSSSPSEFKKLCQEIRNLERSLGTVRSGIFKSEEKEREFSVKSLVIKSSLKVGDLIYEENLEAKRPGHGIDPFDAKKVIGMKVNCNLKKGSVLTWDLLQ